MVDLPERLRNAADWIDDNEPEADAWLVTLFSQAADEIEREQMVSRSVIKAWLSLIVELRLTRNELRNEIEQLRQGRGKALADAAAATLEIERLEQAIVACAVGTSDELIDANPTVKRVLATRRASG